MEALGKVDVGITPAAIHGPEPSPENGDPRLALKGESNVLGAVGEVYKNGEPLGRANAGRLIHRALM